ncbi:MAG: mechanosensitive ion channel family protein [Pirellulaceae bacterium]
MPRYTTALVCLLFVGIFSQLSAQDLPVPPQPMAEQPQVDEAAAQRALRQGNPRATVRTFLEAARDNNQAIAIACMDFSTRREIVGARAEWDYAVQLYGLVFFLWDVDLELIPRETEELEIPLLPALRPNGEEERADAEQISLTKGADGLWRFSAGTIEKIRDMASKYETDIDAAKDDLLADGEPVAKPRESFALWLEQQIPSRYREVHFLLPTYQWICLFLLIFAGFFADFFVRWVLRGITYAWMRLARRTDADEITEYARRTWRPIGLLSQALVWYFGLGVFRLPELFRTYLFKGMQIFAVVAAVWTAFHLIDLITAYVVKTSDPRGKKFNDLLLPILSKSLKTFAVCIGALAFAEAFNLPIAGVIGSIGIGGIAIALAAKETLSNLFGSITVMMDRPFEMGDWVVTEGVEGTVEQVGMRSTRIRTFYNSLVTVPNSILITAKVDNMGKRRYRRVSTTIAVQYDTAPNQIDAFCEGIRELIRRQPYTRKDFYHVYFNEFGASSLDIMLYYFLEVPDWSMELREKHRLFVDIVQLAERLKVKFAFPTQTVHLYTEEQLAKSLPEKVQSDPEYAGRRSAAEISGPLAMPSQRPGLVDFPGPYPFDDIDSRR